MSDIIEDRFKEKFGETFIRYFRAKDNGFCIEALILSVNALKAILTYALFVEMRLKKYDEARIKKLIKENKDLDDLVKLAGSDKLGILNKDQVRVIRNYFDFRSKTVHKFINGEVDYGEICNKIKEFSRIHLEIQNTFIKFKAGPIENLKQEKEKKP